MPMFQWDTTSGTDIVSHRFWIYWGVTVPLTLVTFLVWVLWMRYKKEENPTRRWTTSGTALATSDSLEVATKRN